MSLRGEDALILAQDYVDETLKGEGALKGKDGFSPIIEENKNNTDNIYKLDITTADSTFTTPNLKGADGQGGTGGSGEENTIESISVNGVNVSPDENKNVDITVPDSYDDTALYNRVKTIEDDYAKKNEIPDVSVYITEEQLLAKDYADKAYVTEEIAKASTGGEIDLTPYLKKTEATETYVAKESGKSLISDTEIARLASVDNYDDTDIKAEIAKKADATAIPSKVSELTNDSNYQTAEQVNSAVTTEIAKVVADAPEDFNTLKEMSDWIAGHEDDASAMNSAISDNKTAIASLQSGKADKSEIPTTVAELTDSADYAKKTDIPTTLPANGGNADTVNNHTVKSDVPENAVFTDTIYDDTELKGSIAELNRNLVPINLSNTSLCKIIKSTAIETRWSFPSTAKMLFFHMWYSGTVHDGVTAEYIRVSGYHTVVVNGSDNEAKIKVGFDIDWDTNTLILKENHLSNEYQNVSIGYYS